MNKKLRSLINNLTTLNVFGLLLFLADEQVVPDDAGDGEHDAVQELRKVIGQK
jgi:hypothetical protein